jgi:hypothetical protein
VTVKEQHVATVVKEVSAGADDPQHVASVVGAFMQLQPTVGHYVSAYSRELGLEGVVLTLLHASVLARAVELALGRRLRAVRFDDLDAAARGGNDRPLADEEPELWGYVEGNVTVEDATLGGARRKAALEVLAVIARALLDQK